MGFLCMDCYNKIMDQNIPRRHFVLTKDMPLCTRCHQNKRCVLYERRPFFKTILYFTKQFFRRLYRKFFKRHMK